MIFVCVRLREKKKTNFWNLSHPHKRTGTHYLLICVLSNILFYALCDNYEFKYVFNLYSVDIFALSHNCLWWHKIIKQTVGTIHSHICIQNLIICAECQDQIRSFEFNFDLLFHVYIIIRRICVFKHTGCTLVAICTCVALSPTDLCLFWHICHLSVITYYTYSHECNVRRHLVFEFGPGAIALNLMAALYPT